MPNGDMILLDGHNRFEIAAKHSGLPFNVRRLSFERREEAIIWICNHQLGRRNLPLPDKVLLEDRKRNEIAKLAKGKLGGDHKSEEFKKSSPKNSWELKPEELKEKRKTDRKNETDYKIAKAAGTSEDTVRKIRKINEEAPEKIQSIREGKLSVNQAFNAIHPKAPDPVKQAREEHEQFQEKKKDSVVSFQDVQVDKVNQEIITSAMMQDILKLLNEIDKFGLTYKTKELEKLTVKPEEKSLLLERCEACRRIILKIEAQITDA